MENKTEIVPAFNVEEFRKQTGNITGLLDQNKTSAINCANYGRNLIDNANHAGMNEELDKLMASFVKKAKLTVSTMNERRKPYTQMMDKIRDLFTAEEKSVESIISEVQQIRNGYATKLAKEKAEKEEQARQQMILENARIECRASIQALVSLELRNDIDNERLSMNEVLQKVTIENMQKLKDEMERRKIFFDPQDFYMKKIKTIRVQPSIVPEKDQESMVQKAYGDVIHQYMIDRNKELEAYRMEILDKLPSRVEELKRIAEANEIERQRMEEEAKARAEAERRRIEAEKAEAMAKAEAERKLKAEEEKFKAQVNAQADLFTQAPDAKKSYEIEVKAPIGYMLLIQMWWENEGNNLSVEKLEKMTFAKAKKWAEAKALENHRLTSEFVTYKEVFKAK